MLICKIYDNTKVIIKSKIIKVLTRNRINNIKEILIKININRLRVINSNINNIGRVVDKITANGNLVVDILVFLSKSKSNS